MISDSPSAEGEKKETIPPSTSENESMIDVTPVKYDITIKSTELECPVCYRVMTDFIVTDCSHSWCTECHDKINRCPLCREPKPVVRVIDKFLSRVLKGSIRNECADCGFKGTLAQLEKHSLECEKRNIQCAECYCLFPQSTMRKHKQDECPGRKIKCEYCLMKIKFKNILDHQESYCSKPVECSWCRQSFTSYFFNTTMHKVECPERKVPCRWCTSPIRNVDLTNHQAECPRRQIQCHQCGVLAALSAFEDHTQTKCRLRSVKCSECEEIMSVERLSLHFPAKHNKVLLNTTGLAVSEDRIASGKESESKKEISTDVVVNPNFTLAPPPPSVSPASTFLIPYQNSYEYIHDGVISSRPVTEEPTSTNPVVDFYRAFGGNLPMARGIVRCVYCGDTFNENNLRNHHKFTCSSYPLLCRKCEIGVPREHISVHSQRCGSLVCDFAGYGCLSVLPDETAYNLHITERYDDHMDKKRSFDSMPQHVQQQARSIWVTSCENSRITAARWTQRLGEVERPVEMRSVVERSYYRDFDSGAEYFPNGGIPPNSSVGGHPVPPGTTEGMGWTRRLVEGIFRGSSTGDGAE